MRRNKFSSGASDAEIEKKTIKDWLWFAKDRDGGGSGGRRRKRRRQGGIVHPTEATEVQEIVLVTEMDIQKNPVVLRV